MYAKPNVQAFQRMAVGVKPFKEGLTIARDVNHEGTDKEQILQIICAAVIAAGFSSRCLTF